MKNFSFKGREALEIQSSHYPADGSAAWWIGDGEDIVRLTVCAIDLSFDAPSAGYIYVADWGITAGVPAAMEEQGIAEIVTRAVINPYGSKMAIMRVLS